MKRTIGIIEALLTGAFIGFFGVLVSVFSDGALKERTTVIIVILLIYSFISFFFGLLNSAYTWQWGLFIGSPGAFMLMIYTIKDFNILHIFYVFTILVLSCIAALTGKKARKNNFKVNILHSHIKTTGKTGGLRYYHFHKQMYINFCKFRMIKIKSICLLYNLNVIMDITVKNSCVL